MDGIATQCLVANALRAAGQGGIGSSGVHVKEPLIQEGNLTSLICKLKEMGLAIRVGDDAHDCRPQAADQTDDLDTRCSLNRRGIVLRSELSDGGSSPLRNGQCWLLDGKIIEILAFNGEDLEVMEWTLKRPLDGLGPSRDQAP